MNIKSICDAILLFTEISQVANMLLISNKISIYKNTLVVWLFS